MTALTLTVLIGYIVCYLFGLWIGKRGSRPVKVKVSLSPSGKRLLVFDNYLGETQYLEVNNDCILRIDGDFIYVYDGEWNQLRMSDYGVDKKTRKEVGK